MAQWYRQALLNALSGKINWTSDAITLTLHSASYVPNLDTDAFVSNLTGELATGNGYTAGGIVVGTLTRTYTAANAWATAAATTTAYTVGTVVRPATGNGYVYRCAVAGTSGGTAPAWGTIVGGTTVDGGIIWENVGSGVIALGGANAQWAAPVTAGPFRYAVLSDRTPVGATNQPLIGLDDFGTGQTGGGGDLTIDFNAQGALMLFTP
jgi:hypothetical protein